VAHLGPLDLLVKSYLKNDVLLAVHSIKKASYFVYFIYGFICGCPLIIHGCTLLLG
jgi:hypothetical protein